MNSSDLNVGIILMPAHYLNLTSEDWLEMKKIL